MPDTVELIPKEGNIFENKLKRQAYTPKNILL